MVMMRRLLRSFLRILLRIKVPLWMIVKLLVMMQLAAEVAWILSINILPGMLVMMRLEEAL
jgi:hypothetical protein